MFGGFDGEFYNDLNVMELKPNTLETSTKEFSPMVDCFENFDIKFKLYGEGGVHMVRGIKSFILYRTVQREMPTIQGSPIS